jgi:PelA/Pel-15E family pectate lyase
MKRISKLFLILLFANVFNVSAIGQNNRITNERILEAVKKATSFMVEKVSYKGGFVWDYLPDFSRQWGEMEANRTMAWTQSNGTPAMGEFFLDLYHATGDEYYYQAAEKVASALIWGQHPSGGWNYCFDFAGEASLRQWYGTIGKNGWRLEEFQHYYGNATYDDDATASPGRFILRIYCEKNDPKYRPSVDKTIQFLIDSQYPIGGWPQRYPLMYEYSKNGAPDYSSYITFNDGVHRNNVDLLVLYYRVLGEQKLVDPILRAMNCVLTLQQGGPQPGWGDQFSLDYLPNHARSYEPRSLNTRQTTQSVENLMDFYQITGESKFLSRIPEALDWVESVKLSAEDVERYGGEKAKDGNIVCPMYIEIGTNRGLYTHKVGSNVMNGRYVVSYSLPGKLAFLKMQKIRERYYQLKTMPVDKATANSPFKSYGKAFTFPDYVELSLKKKSTPPEIEKLIGSLVNGEYWLAPILSTSNRYIGDGSMEVVPDVNVGRQVGDKFDTSPFSPNPAILGITTKSFMENVSLLIAYLKNRN